MDTQRSLPPIAHILHPPPSPSTSSPRLHHGKQHTGTTTSSSSASYPTTCNCHPHSSRTPPPTMHLSPAPPISPCPSPTFPPQQQRATSPQHNHAQQRYLTVPPRITTDTYNRTTTVRTAVGPPSPLSPTSTTGDDQKSATSSTSSTSLPPLQGDDPPRPLRTYRPMKHHGSSSYGRIFSSWDSSVTSPAPHYYGHYHHKELSPSPPPAPLLTPGTRSSARFPSHSRQVSSPSALQMTRPSAPPSPLPPPPHQPPVSYANPAPSATVPVTAPRASRSASTADTSRKRCSTEEATPPLTHSRTCSSASTASTHDEDVIMLERPRQNKTRPRATSSASCASAPERPPPPPSTQILFTATGEPILKRRRGRPPSLREPSWEGGWTFLTPTVWTVNSPAQQQLLQARDEDSSEDTTAMDGSMAAFTSASMDAVLQMPKKKRGRKPKTQIAGNSCFVWRDLTATRNASKKKNSSSAGSSSSSSKP